MSYNEKFLKCDNNQLELIGTQNLRNSLETNDNT
jgi:hypothetical protein